MVVFVLIFLILLLPVIKFYFFALFSESEENINEVCWAVKQTCIITASVIFIVVPLSMMCAFAITYTNIKCKDLFATLCILPLFLPPISFGFALLFIWGKSGIVYSFLGIRIPLTGKIGIIMGLILYTFPPAFLMFKNSMQRTDVILYENAVLLGISLRSYMFRILFPQIRKTIVTVFFSVMLLAMTEYSICLVVGGKIKTLALLIYRKIFGSMEFSAAAVMGFLLIIPFFLLIISDSFSQDIIVQAAYRKILVPENKKRDYICGILLFFVSCMLAFPIFLFLFIGFTESYPVNYSFTLKYIIQAVQMPYIEYYINSVKIALMTALFGTILAFFAALYARKGIYKWERRTFYIISVVPQIFPGLLYGTAYILLYKGTIIYNTLLILIMVNIAHFFPSPFLYAYHSFGLLGKEMEDLIKLYGIPQKHAVYEIYIPCLYTTICDMFFFFFVNAMITISAVVFLYTSRTMPYAVILNNFEGNLEYLNKTSAISCIILLTNIFAFGVNMLMKKLVHRHEMH